jgi:hypothetical protein
VPAGEPEHLGDVVDRPRPQHGVGSFVNDLAEVVRVGVSGDIVEQQGAVELGDLVELRVGPRVRSGDPAAGTGAVADDRQAGDRLRERAPAPDAGIVDHRQSFFGGRRSIRHARGHRVMENP